MTSRVRTSVKLSLTKTIVKKEKGKWSLVCPFRCEEKFIPGPHQIDRHFLQVHGHILRNAWTKDNFKMILYWCNFVSTHLRNSILFQYAEKAQHGLLFPPKLELPPSAIRTSKFNEQLEKITEEHLNSMSKTVSSGLLNDPVFPLVHKDEVCYVCMEEEPKIQLCPENPSHGVCPLCAIKMIDLWLVRGKLLGNIVQYGEGFVLETLSNDTLRTEILTPCGLCRLNVAKDWKELILLRRELIRFNPFALADYKPGQVIEAHARSIEMEIQEQRAAAQRFEEVAIWGDSDEDTPTPPENNSDPDYEPNQ